MTLRFLLGLLRPYRGALLLLMAIMIAQSGVVLVIPWISGLLGAEFLGGGGAGIGAPGLAAIVLGLLAVGAALTVVSSLMFGRVSETILADLRIRLFDHLLALPLPWHQARTRGDVIAVISVEAERLGQFVTGTLITLPPLLLTAIGASVLMFRIDPVLSFLVPILIPAFYIMTRVLDRLLRGLAQRIQEEHATTVSMFEEMLDLLPAIKSFTVEPVERRKFAGQVKKLKALSMREERIYAFIDPVMGFAVSAATVVLLFMAGRSLQAGDLTPAETISFLMYVGLLVRPVSELATVYGQVQTARGALARMKAVLAEQTEPATGDHPQGPIKGDIRFEGVTFAYPGRTAAVRDMSLHIQPGETVALTGPNGAGKTTAIGLLMRFFLPEQGRILLDGQDISALALDDLRGAIGHVSQSRYLRSATVAENIGFGQPGVRQEDIEAAAKIAQAHQFITALPQGYETEVGDKGVRLSGGQQQRIALARALVKDPPILILDEATSMYDLEGEAEFIEECREALSGRTVILITHRPASLALADRILHMEDGRIVSGASAA